MLDLKWCTPFYQTNYIRTMNTEGSILEELYTDGGGFDARKVVDALKPILNIKRGGAALYFTREGNELKNEDKLLAVCLVKKLLKHEGVIEDSGISGKEICDLTELPKGTVDNTIHKLKKSGLLTGSGKSYEIPTRYVDMVVERITGNVSKK